MERVIVIIRDNYSTFYDYRTDKRDLIWPRIVIFLVTSVALAGLPLSAESDFLGGVITVQAILIGFSFSVMFFLVQLENKKETNENESIEKRVRSDQLEKLSKEIFWNVSYFNLVALTSLLSALLLLLPNGWTHASAITADVSYIPRIAHCLLSYAGAVSHYAIAGTFFFLLIDSAFTFARTVGRVNFLFEEKMPST